MRHRVQRGVLFAPALFLVGCLSLETLRAVGPVVKLTAPVPSVDATPNQEISLAAQALDVNGVGVDGAWVTFTREDGSHLSWVDAPAGADAVSVKTAAANVAAVSGSGFAVARAKVPSDAPEGDTTVFAVLKGPADDSATLTAKIVVHIKAASDAGPEDAAPTDSGDGDAAAGMGGTKS
jgi:hypothetical protein